MCQMVKGQEHGRLYLGAEGEAKKFSQRGGSGIEAYRMSWSF